mgnify:CR=1 FL=1
MSRKYKFHNKQGLYFVSFATVYWLDIFTRQVYLEVLAESVDYCRANKGMELYAYCFMPSHIHFIFRSANEQPMELLRDFKRHTAKKVIEAIENNPQESRKEWLLSVMLEAGKKNSKKQTYQLWRNDNHPIELYNPETTIQKLNYIHNNPVEAGIAERPEEYIYSSAKNYAGELGILKVKLI